MKWIPLLIALVVGLLGLQVDHQNKRHRAEINTLYAMVLQLQAERDSLRDLNETRQWQTQRWRSMVVANPQWLNYLTVQHRPHTRKKLNEFNTYWTMLP